MIRMKPPADNGILEFQMTGTLTSDDYRDVLAPALDQALAEHDRVRLLARIGPEFDGYSAGAALEDARLGLRHWRGFERVAVVTDIDWIANMVRVMGFAMPGPVETFDQDELEQARRWLSESLGSLHMTDLGNGILHVQLLGKLDPAAYERAESNLDAYVRDHDGFGLLLDLREFDGWQGLAALGDHLKLVRERRHIPGKVAIVGDEAWQKLAQKVLRHFVPAQTRYFEEDQFEAAKRFLA